MGMSGRRRLEVGLLDSLEGDSRLKIKKVRGTHPTRCLLRLIFHCKEFAKISTHVNNNLVKARFTQMLIYRIGETGDLQMLSR
jgi:hypothetical protein